MGKIFHFKPRASWTAEQNLKDFIKKCRYELTVFGEDLDWDAIIWPGIVRFSKLGCRGIKPNFEQTLDSEFIDFAKAYLRYQKGHSGNLSIHRETYAIRVIEAALLKITGKGHICNISVVVLDEAIMLARSHYAKTTAYDCGRGLEQLVNFLVSNNLVTANISGWSNPLKADYTRVRIGEKANVVRASKMPSEEVLNAMAEIFASDPVEHRDIFTTSTFAMLMCAPSRISEVLGLPVDCEVVEIDRDGIERYGWRFFAGKGYGGDIKWIPSPMVPIAKEAVVRLTRLSKNARELALWIEKHPDEYFHHQDCPDVSGDELLTIEEACKFLGVAYTNRKICRVSLAQRGLVARDGFHTLNSLWKYALGKLPKDFPWFDKEKGIKYSNALFALNKSQLKHNVTTCRIELIRTCRHTFSQQLSKISNGKYIKQGILDRYGYLSENGESLKTNSHSVRHFVNTISQRGALANHAIAKWSGRANEKQNQVYNHMTEYELVSMAERIDDSLALFGPEGDVHINQPMSSQLFNTLNHAAVHVTEYGFCVHDYVISPCQRYRDCINCREQICIKGIVHNLKRIKERLERTEKLYLLAQKDIKNGSAGVDRWYEYHEKIVVRLKELVEILENPDLEDGTQVRLRSDSLSQLSRVIAKRSRDISFLSTKEDGLLE